MLIKAFIQKILKNYIKILFLTSRRVRPPASDFSNTNIMLGQILFKIEIILNQLLTAQVGSIDVNKLEFENLVGLSIYDRQIPFVNPARQFL